MAVEYGLVLVSGKRLVEFSHLLMSYILGTSIPMPIVVGGINLQNMIVNWLH